MVDRPAYTKVSADKYEHINHLMEIKEVKERVSETAYLLLYSPSETRMRNASHEEFTH